MARSVPGALFAVLLLAGTASNLAFAWRHADTRACCNLGIDTAAYDELAWNVARTGRLDVPVSQPPGFVAFLAAIYRVAGHDYLAPKLVFALLVGAIAAGTWWLGRRYAGAWEGLVAGGLVLASPMFRAYAATLQYEVFVTFLLLATCLLLLAGMRTGSPRRAPLLFSAAACAAAACALTREVLLAFFPVLLLAVWIHGPGTRRQRLVVACVMTGLLCALVGSWIAWQYQAHGQLVPISDKGPYNFRIGNNPNATGLYNLHLAPLGDPSGWAFLREQPAAALALAGRKVLYFWGIAKEGWHVPSAVPVWLARLAFGAIPLEWIETLVRSAIPLACLGGISLMFRRPALRTALWTPAAAILLLTLVHGILISSHRFALPVLPYVFLFAAVAMVRAVRACGPLLRRRRLAGALAGVGAAWAAALALGPAPAIAWRIEAERLEGPPTVVADPLARNGVSRFHGRVRDRKLVGVVPAQMFPAGHPVVRVSARAAGAGAREILEVRLAGYEQGPECRGRLAWPGGEGDHFTWQRLSLPCPYAPRRLGFLEISALAPGGVWIDDVRIDFLPTSRPARRQ